FAGGADKEVGIGAGGRVEAGGDLLLVELQTSEAAFETRHFEDGVDGVDDLGAPSVVNGEVDEEAAVAGGGVDGEFELAAHLRGQRVEAADGLQADVVLLKVGELLLEIEAEQAPEGLDFVAGTLPVLHREGVECQGLDAEARAGLHAG